MIPKHKQIPNYYKVIYVVSTINTLFFFFSVLYFDLYKFYWNIGIGSYVIVIFLGILYFISWSHKLITKNLESDKLNIKSLRNSIILHFILSIALIFGIVVPYFEVEFNLTNKILNILTHEIPSITTKSLDYISKFISGFISFLVSTIIAIIQGILGTIIYERFIKPRLKKKKETKEKQ
jgi:hypothetical protein